MASQIVSPLLRQRDRCIASLQSVASLSASSIAPDSGIVRSAARSFTSAISAPSATAIARDAFTFKAATPALAHVTVTQATASAVTAAAVRDAVEGGASLGRDIEGLLLGPLPTSGDATGTAEVSEGHGCTGRGSAAIYRARLEPGAKCQVRSPRPPNCHARETQPHSTPPSS